jgi:hypothetical protein
LVIIAMLVLGTFWSVTAYNDWIDNPGTDDKKLFVVVTNNEGLVK